MEMKEEGSRTNEEMLDIAKGYFAWLTLSVCRSTQLQVFFRTTFYKGTVMQMIAKFMLDNNTVSTCMARETMSIHS